MYHRSMLLLIILLLTGVGCFGQPAPEPVPDGGGGIPNDCTPVGTCTQENMVCPSGTECSGIPAYRCYPVGCPYPICLSAGTMIATPNGDVAVENIKAGMIVWSLDKTGNRIEVPVLRFAETPVEHHQVIDLVLSDGRRVQASAGHPLPDGRVVDQLRPGQDYDGAQVLSAALTDYAGSATYDLLPKGATGAYFANGIVVGSSLYDR